MNVCKSRINFIIFLVFVGLFIRAQTPFEQVQKDVFTTHGTLVSIAVDLNQDHVDDIVVVDSLSTIYAYIYNAWDGVFIQIPGPTIDGGAWAGVASDFDRDGRVEVVVGTAFKGVYSYTFDYEKLAFESYTAPFGDLYVQNMNVVDVDGDGFLDLFICNDHGENRLYQNNKNNGFVETSWSEWTQSGQHTAGNYGSVWTDVNGDGLLDQYTVKCKPEITDPNSPKRKNQLFINNGNGTFDDAGSTFGIDYGDQSWAADFGDLDNDGDEDLVVLNHESPLILAEQVNGTFITKPLGSIKPLELFWQVAIWDIDLDGWKDIIISGEDLYVYRNIGGFQFEPYFFEPNEKPVFDIYSFAIGDFDQNGAPDFFTTKGYGFTIPSPNPDALYLQKDTDNNWIKIALRGDASNPHGIGARIIAYSGTHIQYFTVKAGVSYGTMNSLQTTIGFGQVWLDSLEIQWPSGTIQKVENLEPNTTVLIQENLCVLKQPTIYANKDQACLGDELLFTKAMNPEVKWHNGSVAESYITKQSEIIYGIASKDDCTVNSPKFLPFLEDTATIHMHNSVEALYGKTCPGESIELKAPIGHSYLWNTGSMDSVLTTTQSGLYTVRVEQICNETYVAFERKDDSIFVEWPSVPFVANASGIAELFIEADSLAWFYTPHEKAFETGTKVTLQGIFKDSLFYAQAYNDLTVRGTAGLTDQLTNGDYPIGSVNPKMLFTVKEALYLESVSVYTKYPGVRILEIYNNADSLVYAQAFDLKEGENTLEFNVYLGKGNYHMFSNEAENVKNFGNVSPYLIRTFLAETPYPLSDEHQYIELTGNSFSNSNYYFYYNWKVYRNNKVCASEYKPIEVDAVTDTESNTLKASFICFPNPTKDILTVHSEVSTEIELYNVLGQLKLKRKILAHVPMYINVSNLASGYYLIKDGKNGGSKIISIN